MKQTIITILKEIRQLNPQELQIIKNALETEEILKTEQFLEELKPIKQTIKIKKYKKWDENEIYKYLEERAKGKTDYELIRKGYPKTIQSKRFKDKIKRLIETIPELKKYKVY